ncbi:MAG TPA: 30S ribosomal protein S4e [Candidatus Nanoarchaeia archaeon]|nr:30S ribosomal protein S4e [Candidatus Nanoarchaeia archaeon]
MVKKHLKRLAAPKTWHITRKTNTYVTKPRPGPHKLENCMPLGLLLKETLKLANTTREVKKMLNTNEIKIDGKARKDPRFGVGIFDVIEFVTTNDHYKITLNNKGRLEVVKIKHDEAKSKPAKIVGKTMVKGKLQLNLYDGKNITADKSDYKVGDSVLLSLPEQKIMKHLKLEKKAAILLTGGKHIGETGHVEDISGTKIIYKDAKGEVVETSKEYAFVIHK